MRTASGAREAGRRYSVSELVDRLMHYAPVFAGSDGGVTFSGGEPLMQAPFLAAVLRRLQGRLHTLLQTSGCASREAFQSVFPLADLVYFDFKLADPDGHRRFTGKDNTRILDNLHILDASGRPYRLRMPLVPGVTDTPGNYEGLRRLIAEDLQAGGLEGLDLLPYNRAAGGKYQAVGRDFQPGYDEDAEVRVDPDYFRNVVREVKVL